MPRFGGGTLNDSADGGIEAFKSAYHIGATVTAGETVMPSTQDYLSAVKAGGITAKLPGLDLVGGGPAGGPHGDASALQSMAKAGMPGDGAGLSLKPDALGSGAGQLNLGEMLGKLADPIGVLGAILDFLKSLFTSMASEAMTALDPSQLYAHAAEAASETAKKLTGA